jgi:hypothetical protein
MGILLFLNLDDTVQEMTNNNPAINKQYFIVVSLLTFVIPLAAFIIEHLTTNAPLSFILFGKWFIFSAVGLRLAIAGVRQISKPGFTAKEIFHIESAESWPIVRELGFANLCFGLVGIISLFKPDWRNVSSFASGIYYALAGILHLQKKSAGANEQFALWTDLFIFALLTIYFILTM